MPDANTRRQQRHDHCRATTLCPSCYARPGQSCGVQKPNKNGNVYPRHVMEEEIRRVSLPVPPLLKPITEGFEIQGTFMRLGWHDIGGLHAARWEAWAGPDAVSRLGELLDA